MADPSPQAIDQPVSAIGMSKIECLVRLAPLSALKLKLALLPSGCASRIPSEPVSLHSEEGEFELGASVHAFSLGFSLFAHPFDPIAPDPELGFL